MNEQRIAELKATIEEWERYKDDDTNTVLVARATRWEPEEWEWVDEARADELRELAAAAEFELDKLENESEEE